jgi:hypothetical protein
LANALVLIEVNGRKKKKNEGIKNCFEENKERDSIMAGIRKHIANHTERIAEITKMYSDS